MYAFVRSYLPIVVAALLVALLFGCGSRGRQSQDDVVQSTDSSTSDGGASDADGNVPDGVFPDATTADATDTAVEDTTNDDTTTADIDDATTADLNDTSNDTVNVDANDTDTDTDDSGGGFDSTVDATDSDGGDTASSDDANDGGVPDTGDDATTTDLDDASAADLDDGSTADLDDGSTADLDDGSTADLVDTLDATDDAQDANESDTGGTPDASSRLLLPKTGVTNSLVTKDDGDLRVGLSWPVPRFEQHGDGTLTDRLTGLMWFRELNCTTDAKTWAIAFTLRDKLNAGTLTCPAYTAGYDDWRLPTIAELETLSRAQILAGVDWTLPAPAPQQPMFWSSTSYDADLAFSFSLQYGFYFGLDAAFDTDVVRLDPKAGTVWEFSRPTAIFVRPGGLGLVDIPSTGQVQSYQTGDDGDLQPGLKPPASRFVDLGDGTIRDVFTALVWLKDADCYNKSVTFYEAIAGVGDLNDGLQLCAGYSAKHSDWRLPNRKELMSLFRHVGPAVPPSTFVDVVNGFYWTSSYSNTHSSSSSGKVGYTISVIELAGGEFHSLTTLYAEDYGGLGYSNKGHLARIWPVRGGPKLLLATNPVKHDFPNTEIESASDPLVVTVTNVGDTAQRVAPPSLSGSSYFLIESDGCSWTVLAPGASCELQLVFAPKLGGSYSGMLRVSDEATVELSGVAVGPKISISPEGGGNFGTAHYDTAKPKNVTITNTGNGPTAISLAFSFGGADPDSFRLGDNGCDGKALAVGQSCTVVVELKSTKSGSVSTSFKVSAVGFPSISTSYGFVGTVEKAPQVGTLGKKLDFGNVTVGQSADLTATVIGNNSTLVISMQLEGTEMADFELIEPIPMFCKTAELACSIQVRFTPGATGTRTAYLRVFTNDPLEPEVLFLLTGVGM